MLLGSKEGERSVGTLGVCAAEVKVVVKRRMVVRVNIVANGESGV